jgi:hypothetical protein
MCVDWIDAAWGTDVSVSCVQGNERTGLIEYGEFIDYLSCCWILKKGSVPWSYLLIFYEVE